MCAIDLLAVLVCMEVAKQAPSGQVETVFADQADRCHNIPPEEVLISHGTFVLQMKKLGNVLGCHWLAAVEAVSSLHMSGIPPPEQFQLWSDGWIMAQADGGLITICSIPAGHELARRQRFCPQRSPVTAAEQ